MTYKELLDSLEADLTPEDVEFIRNNDPDDIGVRVHFGFGRNVRNTFSLWSEESADLKEEIWNSLPLAKKAFYIAWWKGAFMGRNMHADDASSEIIRALIKRVKESN
jgi:hypothetical protein